MKERYKLGEFARMIGVHPQTLQRYDREHKIIAYRTETNRRYYKYEQYLEFNKDNNLVVSYMAHGHTSDREPIH